MGFFSEWTAGTNAERLLPRQRAAWAQRVPAEWVRSAACTSLAAAMLCLKCGVAVRLERVPPSLFMPEEACQILLCTPFPPTVQCLLTMGPSASVLPAHLCVSTSGARFCCARLDHMCRPGKPLALQLGLVCEAVHEPLQVWLAALHDLVMCEADRHTGNIVVGLHSLLVATPAHLPCVSELLWLLMPCCAHRRTHHSRMQFLASITRS